MANINNISDWNFNDNYRELFGLITSAFKGRKRKGEEEVAMLVAALFFLRKNNSLRVVKTADVVEDKDHVIICLNDSQYTRKMDFCLCCDNDLLEGIENADFCALLLRTLDAYKDAAVPSYVLDFVFALNKQEFQDGELLVLLDKCLKELSYLSREVISQPKELSRLVSYVVDDKSQNIFDPFGGLMDFAITMPDKHFVGYEINETTRNLALYRMALAGIESKSVLYRNSAENWTDDVFDAIVTFPPFGYRVGMKDNVFDIKTDVDQAVFARFEKTTNEHGQLVIVVALSTLFKETSAIKKCRESITRNNWLDKVVVLPSYMFHPHAQLLTAVVVLKKDRKKDEKIRFVDATQCIQKKSARVSVVVDKMLELIDNNDGVQSIDVTTEAIIEQDYSWLVGLYLYQHNASYKEGYEVRRFRDIFQVAPSSTQFNETVGPLVNGDAFSRSNLINFEFKPQEFVMTDDLIGTKRVAEPVLLVSLGVNAFPIYCEASDDNPIFIKSSNIEAYRIISVDVNLGYLCIELFHRYAVLSRYVSAYYYRRLFEEVQLSFPSVAEQENLYEGMKRTAQEGKIRELGLQKTIDDLVAVSKKQFRARKHSLMQNSSSLAADWEDLKEYLLGNDGRFDQGDTIGVLNPVKIGEIINTISENIKIMENKIYHLTDEDIDWGKAEEIDLQDFIKEYINSHKNARYRFEFEPRENVNLEVADQTGIAYYQVSADWKVLISKKALLQVFDNIVTNARDHGFDGNRNSNNVVKFDFSYTFNGIVLEISNNGKPLDDGVDTEYIKTFGYSTKLNMKDGDGKVVHSGDGGSEMDGILQKYNASYEVISEPDALFTVTYRIVFNNIKDTIVGAVVPDF